MSSDGISFSDLLQHLASHRHSALVVENARLRAANHELRKEQVRLQRLLALIEEQKRLKRLLVEAIKRELPRTD